MASNAILFITLALFNFSCISLAFDPRPLQDFCVVDPTGTATCKDPKTVTANDFFFNLGPGNTSNSYGAGATFASPATVPGFNTLGQVFVRADFRPNGYTPPHTHPRASELNYVLEGMIEVGFITSYPDYTSYSKILKAGDVFIVPVGLIHYVRNLAKTNSVVLVAFNSQNPGSIFIPDSVFAAKPPINSRYLAGAFKLDENTIKDLQTKPWYRFV
ncbi:germin-like protein subfamily 1 member 3 [Salvia miltiorrhiza]|uniref:germin-like protein subfamily 1 member 3 n=1 Tax=Salvia miltiorrhiza TaxID=226208 RepID=UPI0025AC73B9|nr:germin-like protein subfamily 1 member 3 [Salvia miltiorrhiza]